jgi:hypothetical protein
VKLQVDVNLDDLTEYPQQGVPYVFDYVRHAIEDGDTLGSVTNHRGESIGRFELLGDPDA